MFVNVFLVAALAIDLVSAQFYILEPGYTANTTAATLSTTCIDAMESQVDCNEWFQSNAMIDVQGTLNSTVLATLCTTACGASLASYRTNVITSCAGEPQPFPGLPATYYGDITSASFNITCLTDTATGEYCSDFFNNIAAELADDVPMTSLSEAQLCSPCILSLGQTIQGTSFSNYDLGIASQWSSIQSTCGVEYPVEVQPLTTNLTSLAGFASPTNFTSNSTSPAFCLSGTKYTVVSGDGCIGISAAKNVATGTLRVLNDIFPDCTNLELGQSLCLPQSCSTYNIQANDTCVGISAKNNLTYTQLSSWNPTINPSCTNLITGEYLCLSQPGAVWSGTTILGATGTQTALYATATVTPPGNVAFDTTIYCGKYYQVKQGDYCQIIALNNTISIDLFEAINPSINAGCTNLVVGLYYCVDPTAQWNSTNTTSTLTTYVSAPAPTPSGTTPDCYEYYTVVANDTCALIESAFGITFAQFQAWNPSIDAACLLLQLGDAYCVDGNNVSVSSTTFTTTSASSTQPPTTTSTSSPVLSTSTSATTVTPPGPTQTGIVSACNAYTVVPSGGSCSAIESEYGITFAQLLAWNPAVGSNCQYLEVGEAYCVGVSSAIAPPASVQAGIVSTCNAYTVVASGGSCSAIESAYLLTFAQFLAWNPAIGSNCQSLELGVAYCVGVSASGTSTSSSVTAPGPTQTGIVANCNAWTLCESGCSCSAIESEFGLTFAQFYAWNPAIGSGCTDLELGEAYCVGV